MARTLAPCAGRLERRFLRRLRELQYDPRERKALAAVTPGAAASVVAAGRLSPDFVEQVEYNGRRLAKLNVSSARILRAFQEYDSLLDRIQLQLAPVERDRLARALEQWYFCVVLTLNHAFQQVGDSEARTCHELFRTELESAGLGELLLRLLQSLVEWSRADSGAIFLRERKGRLWVRRASTPRTENDLGLAVPVGPTDRLSRARCTMRNSGTLGLALDPHWQARFSTCWSVPLMLRGTPAGVIQFGFIKPFQWLPREKDVLIVAAERCVLAAEKARLVEDLAAKEAQVRELAGALAQVEEKERRRISSELHDEAGQSLLCSRLQLELLERMVPTTSPELRAGLAEVRALTERTIVEIRRLVSALSPAVLEELGLAAALRQLASRMSQLRQFQVKLELGPLAEVPAQLAAAGYRLAQECLNNVVRHSQALRVNISAAMADGELRLCVEDNGVGFRVEEAMTKYGSFGLAGMGKRVSLLDGKFQIKSRPGRGTKVCIILPVSERLGCKAQETE